MYGNHFICIGEPTWLLIDLQVQINIILAINIVYFLAIPCSIWIFYVTFSSKTGKCKFRFILYNFIRFVSSITQLTVEYFNDTDHAVCQAWEVHVHPYDYRQHGAVPLPGEDHTEAGDGLCEGRWRRHEGHEQEATAHAGGNSHQKHAFTTGRPLWYMLADWQI